MIEIVKKEMEIIRFQIDYLESKHIKERSDYKEFYEDLKNRLSLSDGFGFNPNTGEII